MRSELDRRLVKVLYQFANVNDCGIEDRFINFLIWIVWRLTHSVVHDWVPILPGLIHNELLERSLRALAPNRRGISSFPSIFFSPFFLNLLLHLIALGPTEMNQFQELYRASGSHWLCWAVLFRQEWKGRRDM